jgi:hypothetical protein
VARDAADRPRALAAAILARALRRPPGAAPAPLPFVEDEVRRVAAAEAAGNHNTEAEVTAEIVYEIGSILVELRDRFPESAVERLLATQE